MSAGYYWFSLDYGGIPFLEDNFCVMSTYAVE